MTTVSQKFALNISKVKIVRSKDERYFGDGNSVPTIKFPHLLSFRAAELARRSTSYVFTGGAEDLGHRHCRCRAGTERDQQQQEEEGEEESEDMAASDLDAVDDRIAKISAAIRVIPDFPKPDFFIVLHDILTGRPDVEVHCIDDAKDITTLLLDWKAFKDTIDLFVERYKEKNISVVAGVEARGFIFGPPIALAIGAKFVPMRKPKKLPGEVISEEYSLEYGTDRIEMHVGAVKEGERALVIDDLIATGGTLCAAIRLLERVGVHVVECACVIELPELKGRERLGDKPLFVLVSSS